MLPIVAIQGGLGNQLSQWFYAHTIDASGQFQIDPLYPESTVGLRNFELYELIDKCSHIQTHGKKIILKRQKLFFKLLDRAWELKIVRPMVEAMGYFREDPRKDQPQSANKWGAKRYSKGYFQLQEKMELSKVAVCSELVPTVEKVLATMQDKFKLPRDYSVIHVRRGDYQPQVFTSIYLGILDDSYFSEWVRDLNLTNLVLLTENVSDVSNLISVVKPILTLDKSQTSAWETLAIISGAQNFLGSNSTLSWWGSRLCAIHGGSVWLPSEWSFWKNVDNKDYIFSGCKTRESRWILNVN
jgi:hypothetical protein